MNLRSHKFYLYQKKLLALIKSLATKTFLYNLIHVLFIERPIFNEFHFWILNRFSSFHINGINSQLCHFVISICEKDVINLTCIQPKSFNKPNANIILMKRE